MKIIMLPKRIFLILLFPLGMILFYITSFTPDFIENVFSRGINKLFFQILSSFTGLIPVSIAELGLMVLVILVPIIFFREVLKAARQKSHKRKAFLNLLVNILIVVSLVYFSLVVLWSLNYNRHSFAEIAHLDTHPASVIELGNLCDNLVNLANKQRQAVHENAKGIMVLTGGVASVFKNAADGYEKEAGTYSVLSGSYGRPKSVLLSKAMSYTGIIGLFCPFTAEANIDTDIPDYSIPSTVCHEMAHQHGFAREDEANYIAWLTCEGNPDVDFQYSGTILALLNSMDALSGHDRNEYLQLIKKLSDGVRRDLNANNAYWRQHQGPVENVTTSLNNAYLKANRQKDGVYSYGRMVDLLIAEYRK
jgi:hypothetical protein